MFFWKKSKDNEKNALLPESKRKKEERRESKRLLHAVGVRSSELPNLFAIARDLSISGLKIQLDGKVNLGQKLEITLDLDLVHQSVPVSAEVVWVKRTGIKNEHEAGLHFISMTWEAKTSIEKFIKKIEDTLQRFM